jgi:hypothetical protein
MRELPTAHILHCPTFVVCGDLCWQCQENLSKTFGRSANSVRQGSVDDRGFEAPQHRPSVQTGRSNRSEVVTVIELQDEAVPGRQRARGCHRHPNISRGRQAGWYAKQGQEVATGHHAPFLKRNAAGYDRRDARPGQRWSRSDLPNCRSERCCCCICKDCRCHGRAGWGPRPRSADPRTSA